MSKIAVASNTGGTRHTASTRAHWVGSTFRQSSWFYISQQTFTVRYFYEQVSAYVTREEVLSDQEMCLVIHGDQVPGGMQGQTRILHNNSQCPDIKVDNLVLSHMLGGVTTPHHQ